MKDISTATFNIDEKDRYQFEIHIKPEGINSNNFANPLLFDLIWLFIVLLLTLGAIVEGANEVYFSIIFWIAGITNLARTLSHYYTKHSIKFTHECLTFIKKTLFSTTELEMNFKEINKIHANHLIKKKIPQWTGRHSKSKETKTRGLVTYYENTNKYEFADHLTSADQIAIADFINERIEERKKFLR